jgi:hypothetical protein
MKKKFSPLRVLAGVAVAAVILAGLLYADEQMANLPYYKDILPMYSSDGKNVLFVRWVSFKNGCADQFELWLADTGTGKQRMVYESSDGYNAFSIRKIKISSDSSSVGLRLNKEFKNGGQETIKDKLVSVPLSEGSQPREWELDKKHPFDVFLDFWDDRVIVRRMREDGKHAASDLFEMSFSKRDIIRQIPFDRPDHVCTVAKYQGGGKKLFGVVKVPNPQEAGASIYELYDLSGTPRSIYPHPDHNLTYLPGRNLFVEFEHDKKFYFIIRDGSGKILKILPSPLGREEKADYFIPADESRIVCFSLTRICTINLDTLKASFVERALPRVGFLDASPDGSNYVFSNGEIIFSMGSDGNGLRSLTAPSPRSEWLKKPLYVKYLDARNHIIYGRH